MTRAADLVLRATLIGTALAAVPIARFSLDRFGLPRETIAVAGAALAAALALSAARRLRADLADLALLLFLALSALSALGADNPWLAARALALSAAACAAFWCARSGRGAGLLDAAALAVALAALPALLAAWGVVPDWADGRRAPAGTFGNRNFLAHLLALGLPLLVWRAARSGSAGGARAWAWTAAVALVSATVVLTRTRAAWLALLVAPAAVLLEVVTARVSLRRGLAGGGWRPAAAVVLGVLAALLVPSRLAWQEPSPYLASARRLLEHDAGSGRGRVVQYRTTFGMAGEHPLLGVGPGQWVVHYPRFADDDDPSYAAGSPTPTNAFANSDWIGGLAERGAPAMLALGACAVLLLAGAVRRLREAPDDAPGGDLALVGTLAVLGVLGMLDAVVQRPAPALFAGVIVGALAPRGLAGGVRLDLPLAAPVRLALAAAVLAAGLAAASIPARSIAAGATYAADRRPQALERAAAAAPGEYRLQYLAAHYWTQVRRCDRARPWAARARRLMPHVEAVRQLEARCADAAKGATPAPAR